MVTMPSALTSDMITPAPRGKWCGHHPFADTAQRHAHELIFTHGRQYLTRQYGRQLGPVGRLRPLPQVQERFDDMSKVIAAETG